MYGALEDVGFDDGSICSNILVQAVVKQVFLVFQLVKHLILMAISNILEMMILVENYLALR